MVINKNNKKILIDLYSYSSFSHFHKKVKRKLFFREKFKNAMK